MAAQASKKRYLGAVKTYGGGALIRGGHRSLTTGNMTNFRNSSKVGLSAQRGQGTWRSRQGSDLAQSSHQGEDIHFLRGREGFGESIS